MTSEVSHTVVSGVPYPVTSTAGEPSGLDRLVGESEFTLDMHGTPYRVSGCGGPCDQGVRFHEKDPVLGRDIRVWLVRQRDGGIEAEHLAAW